MVSADFLTADSPQTYQHYIQVVKFLHQLPTVRNFIEDVRGERSGARVLGIFHLDDEAMFFLRTDEGPLMVHATSDLVQKPIKLDPFHASFFYKREDVIYRSYSPFTRNPAGLVVLPFLHSSGYRLTQTGLQVQP